MDIKAIIIETDRQISNSVCCQLNENGFRAERVSYIRYCRDKETSASYDLIIYMVGKYDHTDDMPKFSRPVLFVLEQNDHPMQKKTFTLGMADYIIEPINITEIISRLYMLLHCYGVKVDRELITGKLSLDKTSREVKKKKEV